MFEHVGRFLSAQCIAPLGMESGMIPDRDITASSSFNDGNVAPQNGRWVPLYQSTNKTNTFETDWHIGQNYFPLNYQASNHQPTLAILLAIFWFLLRAAAINSNNSVGRLVFRSFTFASQLKRIYWFPFL